MNEKVLKKVTEQRKLFVPSIFTKKQVEIIDQYLHRRKLSATEKVLSHTFFFNPSSNHVNLMIL